MEEEKCKYPDLLIPFRWMIERLNDEEKHSEPVQLFTIGNWSYGLKPKEKEEKE